MSDEFDSINRIRQLVTREAALMGQEEHVWLANALPEIFEAHTRQLVLVPPQQIAQEQPVAPSEVAPRRNTGRTAALTLSSVVLACGAIYALTQNYSHNTANQMALFTMTAGTVSFIGFILSEGLKVFPTQIKNIRAGIALILAVVGFYLSFKL